ncbi:class I SAM-dependent methyltransferase [Shewanella sp. FJAT-52076]|uniref:class I SAM-dependent methyltransferase n=1 Tax=Shewanella sp. FJAT-52076 TaxID=2864202 RepID=UPI001C659C8C|nr:class I SAM-dependent methyltransferase [Shewanella sp. FJAT-52076]QYJ75209.1 class I SAM-dependent methyltransferase [Shewanella sp. FJAT-52076]
MKAVTVWSLLALSLCTTAMADAREIGPHIRDAMADQARPEADRGRDIQRKPDLILSYFEVAPGQKVLDLFSGGGYYTELLARAVGRDGRVVAHNNQAYLPFAGDELKQRDYAARLPNVETLLAEANDLHFVDQSFDRIFFVLGFHDALYSTKDWPAIDLDKLVALMQKSLKSGGQVAIIDHRAKPGSGADVAEQLHRMDPALVIATMTEAGFRFDGELDALANKADPLDISVFDKRIRGHSDRFVLKFTKP